MAGKPNIDAMLDVGAMAPGFTLENHDGDAVSLADHAGQPVVVYFYPRADTKGCTTEACGFRDAWADYEAAGTAVLGISDDPVDDIAAFRDTYDLPFDLLSDPDGVVASSYDSYGEKTMFGNTFDGVYRNTYLVNADGRIAAVYPTVDPEGHADEVLADIAALA